MILLRILIIYCIINNYYVDAHYRNIIFDFGGVMISGGPQHGTALVTTRHFYDWMLGKITIDELRNKLRVEFDVQEVENLITECCSNNRPWIEETLTIISELKQQNYKIYMLSNLAREVYDVYKHHPIFIHFDGILCSHEIGLMKPDQAFYSYLLEKYDLIAHESIFIDDVLKNIKAAAQIGIAGIVYKPGLLRDALSSQGISLLK